VRVIYTPRYEIDLGEHIWPTVKYRRVAERLVAERIVDASALVEPEACSWEDLALVHTPEYLRKVRNGALSDEEIRILELPWVPGLADGFRLMSGGTCRTAELALQDGVSVHLGGGLHHAFPNHGEGFCLFNDVAVAIRRLQRDGRVQRAAIIDCDVHQGNGTAVVFEGDASVYTLSIHQQHNYPLFKPRSDMDVGVADATSDREYVERLGAALPRALDGAPELVCYLAGADPFRADRLGGLALTFDGLRVRDRMVLQAVRGAGAAAAIVLAGGYAVDVEDTVEVHVGTVIEALKIEPARPGVRPA
jgi:acetoin utilization deacetylase AcuC-like enzyme